MCHFSCHIQPFLEIIGDLQKKMALVVKGMVLGRCLQRFFEFGIRFELEYDVRTEFPKTQALSETLQTCTLSALDSPDSRNPSATGWTGRAAKALQAVHDRRPGYQEMQVRGPCRLGGWVARYLMNSPVLQDNSLLGSLQRYILR